MSRQLIILAGGAGTRLRARLGDLPKPMIPIAGKPLLEHQVELAKKYGFTDLIFFVHYRADLIEKHFGDGKNSAFKSATFWKKNRSERQARFSPDLKNWPNVLSCFMATRW